MKLVKVSASWCKSCERVIDIFEELKDDFSLDYEELDYDQINVEKRNQMNIEKIPLFILYDQQNKEISRIVSYTPLDIYKWVSKNLLFTSF